MTVLFLFGRCFLRVSRLIGALVLSGLMAAPGWAASSHPFTVAVYNTYLGAPFVLETGGLARDLLVYLEGALAPTYRFQLENLPRGRLVRDVLADSDNFDGVVLFLNPAFLADVEQKKYLWTAPLFVDHNLLIFNRPPPPTMTAMTLRGMRFGAVMENRYHGIDDLVAEGSVIREHASNELATLKKLADRRIDFTQMNRSMFLALSRQPPFDQVFYAVPNPWFERFSRHILVGKKAPELAARLRAVVDKMPRDKAWRKILARYQLEAADR